MKTSVDPEVTIRMPQPISAAPPMRIPIIAALAPVLVSLALFAVTQSPMTLVFAVLGPVTAIAGVADGAIGGRRHRRRERGRWRREAAAVSAAIEAAHAVELEDRRAATAAGPMIAADDPRARVRWSTASGATQVVIGTGVARSRVRVDAAGDAGPDGAADVTTGVIGLDDVASLVAAATWLHDAPILADPADGIGVAGPIPLARAVARGVAIQAIAAVGPAAGCIAAAGPAWAEAVAGLPHDQQVVQAGSADSVLVLTALRRGAERPDELARIEVAEEVLEVSARCRTIITIDADGARVARAGRAGEQALAVHPVDHDQFAVWCEAALATAPGAPAGRARRLPDAVMLEDLLAHRPSGPVAAVIGVTPHGPLTVDLAREGPHAVVGGTTGSGKSELLLSWVVSMAAGASPMELAVLLIDFKGGAGFAPIAGLPHVVGVVTDLDAAGAMRAVGSLRAEMRRREAAIAAAGVREHAPKIGMPRLVIVVDEYAALVDLDPELHAVFGDLAARGRSLGIHVIVGTQRPAASVRDAVLANADVRVCLRVRDRADALALVGSAAPAELPANPRGRAIASAADDPGVEVQLAMTDAATVERITGRWSGAPRPARPWRDPLPGVVTRAAAAILVAGHGARGGDGAHRRMIGVIDRPDLQSIEPWEWNPTTDGVLVAIGSAGSGRSGLAAAIAATGPSIRIGPDPASAWDALTEFAEVVGDHGGLTLIVDDLDIVLDRFEPEYRPVVLERVVTICRRRRELGIGIAITALTLDGPLRALEPHVGVRVLMRMPSRQDHRLAGGESSTWDARMPAGGAIVDGMRAQVLAVDPAPPGDDALRHQSVGDDALAIITEDPAAVTLLMQAGGRAVMSPEQAVRALAAPPLAPSVAVVGSVASWQAKWDALDRIGPHATVLLHGLSTAQVRAVTGRRDLPPPLPRSATAASVSPWCWMLTPHGFARANLP